VYRLTDDHVVVLLAAMRMRTGQGGRQWTCWEEPSNWHTDAALPQMFNWCDYLHSTCHKTFVHVGQTRELSAAAVSSLSTGLRSSLSENPFSISTACRNVGGSRLQARLFKSQVKPIRCYETLIDSECVCVCVCVCLSKWEVICSLVGVIVY